MWSKFTALFLLTTLLFPWCACGLEELCPKETDSCCVEESHGHHPEEEAAHQQHHCPLDDLAHAEHDQPSSFASPSPFKPKPGMASPLPLYVESWAFVLPTLSLCEENSSPSRPPDDPGTLSSLRATPAFTGVFLI